MPYPRTTILRWTGKGSQDDLRSSVAYVLGLERVGARISALGESVMLVGPEPLSLAALFGNMPGVSWIAVGIAARSLQELAAAAGKLAGRYLRKGDRFSVEAEGTAGVLASDIAGVVTSAVLDEVKGTRVSIESPKVRFRAAFDGEEGVAGIEVKGDKGALRQGGNAWHVWCQGEFIALLLLGRLFCKGSKSGWSMRSTRRRACGLLRSFTRSSPIAQTLEGWASKSLREDLSAER